jgi:hypothetical protein
MSQLSRQDEGHGFETAMRMGPKGQAAIARQVDLWAVVVEKQKGIDLRQIGSGQGSARDEISDVIAQGWMTANDFARGQTIHPLHLMWQLSVFQYGSYPVP